MFLEDLLTLLQSSLVIAVIITALFVIHKRLLSMYSNMPSKQFRRQLIMLGFILLGLLLIVTLIPVSESLKGQLVGLMGLLLSAAIALSSTTLVGNAMAGIMLKVVKNCRPGDFIRVGDYFGRITEMDLLHTEIQTEDRELTTFPNLYLVTNPVTSLRSSGTIVSVEVSLGYDTPRKTVERLLIVAAKDAGLEEPFVQIRELGDFSVTYRIAGLLTEFKKLLATRRRLRAYTLDQLHDNDIEIVSPTFMNTRALSAKDRMIPEIDHTEEAVQRTSPDALVFDKAEKAESIENMRAKHEAALIEIKKTEEDIAQATEETKPHLEKRLAQLKDKAERFSEIVRKAEERLASQD
ncbi:MAG: mechanosensitive ion channel domain-containing protein [Pseudomonadota bacterium]